MTAAVKLENVSVRFSVRKGLLWRKTGDIHAVDDVSFEIPVGRTVGLVGESGSGKSTTGRAIMGMVPLSQGEVRLFGDSLADLSRRRQGLPRIAQLVFQDPYASLNPRMTVVQALTEVLFVHRLVSAGGAKKRVSELLADVGLPPNVADRHPHALSGGQRQRVAIARALATEPRFLVLDEVVSALDVSIQGQIVNLLQDLQRDRGLTYLLISHDLSVVRHLSHSIVVLYGGQVMEQGPRDAIFANPRHPYTSLLLSAVPMPVPDLERRRSRLESRVEPPDPSKPLPGCRFQRSCRFATETCRQDRPALRIVNDQDGHTAACHHMDRPDVRAAMYSRPAEIIS